MQGIIIINSSFVKQINLTEGRRNQKQAGSEVKTFNVPFPFGEIKKDITINTKTPDQSSKEKIINQAFKFHSEGNISEAAKYYQYFIDQGFNDQRAFSNYGIIFKDVGKLKEAEALLRKAILLDPSFAKAHSNLGTVLIDLGKLKEAEVLLRKAIELDNELAEAYSNLGTVLIELGNLKEAEVFLRKAIEIKPDLADAHSNLGLVGRGLGNLKEAEILLRKAIDIKPDFVNAYLNLGLILRDVGNLKEAEILFLKAIDIKPDFAEAHSNLGNILIDLERSKEAELPQRKAIEIKPDFAEAHLNLGVIFKNLGNLKQAETSTRKAIELKPDSANAYLNLGIILNDLGNYPDAISSYKKALNLKSNLSSAKTELIGSKRDICDWSDEEMDKKWIENIGIEGEAVKPWGFFFLEDNPIKNLTRSQKYYKEKFNQKSYPIAHFKNKKIHIGYFSSDFHEHATMHLISSIFELHDKSKFEIYLYSFSPSDDKYTERAKRSGCFFRDIKTLSTSKSVELARRDKLDIAIDLKGYTKYSRMNIFSQRVAPVQINYLGYPGTLGAETIDYIIADNIVIPKGYEKFYSEKIIRMPNCYQCNNKKEICKEPISRKEFNLPNQGFVFTCFNANRKISTEEFDIWMRLLEKIKGSVLWLYKSNSFAVKNLCKEAEKRNVDPDRLIFANRLPLEKHLARHNLGDLALDTFNCNGHTTTSDALWSGLPVLTKIGESFAARVSASILTSIGLPELITYNEKEYEEKAINIARNPSELIRIKTKLTRVIETSPLYNSELYTKNLEYKFEELVS